MKSKLTEGFKEKSKPYMEIMANLGAMKLGIKNTELMVLDLMANHLKLDSEELTAIFEASLGENDE